MIEAIRAIVAALAAFTFAACAASEARAPCPAATPASMPAPAAAPERPAGLLLDGTPPIPDELRARLQQYLNTRSARLVDLADDGRAILVQTRFGETGQLHLVRAPGGARSQVTFSRDRVQGGRFAPGRSDSLIYASDQGGDEQFQIHRLDLDGWRTTRLTDGKSRNEGAVWSPDGKQLAWSSTARNGRDFDIWMSDGATAGSAAIALEGHGSWAPLEFARDGRSLLLQEVVSIAETRLHLLDLAGKTATPLTPGAPAGARDAALSADGRRVYVASDRAGEFVELHEREIGGSWRPLTRHIPWNVDEIELSADGRTLAFVVNEGGLGRLYLLDTRTRRAAAVAGIPEGVVQGLVFARRAPVLGFTVYGATRTGDAYTYDLRRKALTRWTESEMGGLDPSRFATPGIIHFRSFDGTMIPAFYYRPAAAGRFPVVISIHGGPEDQARPAFSPLTQYLVSELGFAVIEPNVRGSDGYGKSYLALDDAARREDSVKDIGALLDWIAAQKELDPARVAVHGGSYGGYMVLASLVHFGRRIAAGVEIAGLSNLVSFLENTAEYRRNLRRPEWGDERDPVMRKKLLEMSPLTHANRIESPLFVAQGANDPRTPTSEAREIVRAVRGAGHDVWYMLAPDEGHGFARRQNRDTFILLSILFLEKHLGPATR